MSNYISTFRTATACAKFIYYVMFKNIHPILIFQSRKLPEGGFVDDVCFLGISFFLDNVMNARCLKVMPIHPLTVVDSFCAEFNLSHDFFL